MTNGGKVKITLKKISTVALAAALIGSTMAVGTTSANAAAAKPNAACAKAGRLMR